MSWRPAAIATLFAFIALPAAAQQFAPGEPPPGGNRVATVRTTTTVNLHTETSLRSRTLARIPRGATLTLLGCVPSFTWCRTGYAGKVGWVAAAFLTPRPSSRGFPPQPPNTGLFSITGTLTREGVECQALRGDNGRLYTLTTRGRFAPGDRVRVTGTIAQVSFCQQGTTIQVRSIGPA